MVDECGPKIKSISPWFGGKRNLASDIVAELGDHAAYWEPMCGSAAVLFGKPAAVMETINDLHGEVINLARVLADEDQAVRLYGRLARTIMHESLFAEAAARLRDRGWQPAGDVADVDRAADWMLCSWLGRNGVAGTESYNQGFCVRYTRSGGHGATRWTSAVESIPAWHHRLRSVTVLNRDAFALLDRIEDESGTVIYLDPPYVEKGAKYIHDFGRDDHRRLAEGVRRFRRTRVVVSYYDDPLVRELYDGWTLRKVKATKALANQARRDGGAVAAPELLLINGPSLVAPGQPHGLFSGLR